MKLAELAKIAVPTHGMIYAKDHSLLYFIARFDRVGKHKFAVEDFGQLSNLSSEKKYDSSMEKIAQLIDKFCTFPLLEKTKLFRLTLFNFLVGNEDMHLKNFSLLTKEGKTELSPAYDLVNSSIVMNVKEEIALPLHGKKSNLKFEDLIDYFAKERLLLPSITIEEVLQELHLLLPQWRELIIISFLTEERKEAYLSLLENRAQRLFISKI